MKRRTTLLDLANRLGASQTAISLALRDSKKVSPELKQRVRSLAQDLNYVPNHFARSLRSLASRTIGVVFPWASQPNYSMLLDALYQEAKERCYDLDVRFTSWNLEQESRAVESLLGRHIEGLIIIPSERAPFENLLRKLPAKNPIPVAIIGGTSFISSSTGVLPAFVHAIGTDWEKGYEQLGRYLLDMGHNHILLASEENTQNKLSSAHLRFKGLKKSLSDAPNVKLSTICMNDTEMGGIIPETVQQLGMNISNLYSLCEHLVERVLKISPLPSVVVMAGGGLQAQVLLSLLYKKGLRVPDDISVACDDGSYLSAYGPVPVTCVEEPLQETSKTAVDLIVGWISGRLTRRVNCILEPTLIKRASVTVAKGGAVSQTRRKTRLASAKSVCN